MPQYRRHKKGFVPRGMTGGFPYNVIRRVCQDPKSENMAVEEQVVQTEACIYCQIATTTSVEEKDMHTEFCDTEVTKLSPKKRRRKRDKVTSSIKE
jgi:hypothetical protein